MRGRALAITGAVALAGGLAMSAWTASLVAARGGHHTGLLIGMFVIGAAGGVALTLFGWAIRAALGPEPPRLTLRAGEEILLTRPANHARGLGATGYLTFTTQRLLFHARKMSFRREPFAIDLAAIRGARPFSSHHLQLAVGGDQELFVVSDRQDIVRLIEALAAAPEGERAAVFAAWRESPPA
jgi:hypothetical protein